jgi:hypothetical protein
MLGVKSDQEVLFVIFSIKFHFETKFEIFVHLVTKNLHEKQKTKTPRKNFRFFSFNQLSWGNKIKYAKIFFLGHFFNIKNPVHFYPETTILLQTLTGM